jgi:hypothetical protein
MTQTATKPVYQYCHAEFVTRAAEQSAAAATCTGKKVVGRSITGGFIYRGTKYADLIGGDYIFADYQDRILAGARKQPDGTWQDYVIMDSSDFPNGQLFPRIDAFAEDANGELYMIGWGQKPGLDTVYHLPCGRLCSTTPVTPADSNDNGIGAPVPDAKYIPPTVSIPGIVEAEYFKQGTQRKDLSVTY